MPKPKRDDMTADHQPQAAILQWAGQQRKYFKKGSPMDKRAASRAAAGFAINLQSGRHMAGRTYAGKGTKTKNDFVAKAKAAVAKKTSEQDKRGEVVKLIKVELSEDVKKMRSVVADKANFKDIQKLDAPAPEKDKLAAKVKSQILSGQSKIAAQDLDSLKG